MHIPDGYLGPKSCVFLYATMAPLWFYGARAAERSLGLKRLPLMALASAFLFVVMMFNVPVPGGTSGHVTGAAVVAILLGPWAGLMAVTLALTLQALLFGDGGVTALGANALNMGFVLCFSSFLVYRVVAPQGCGDGRTKAAAFIAAYVGASLAALAGAVELGLQPLLAHDGSGTPLYAPYSLKVATVAVMVPHLLFFAPLEGIVTALVVSYVLSAKGSSFASLSSLEQSLPPGRLLQSPRPLSTNGLWAALGILALLTPLGLLAVGTAWGEWTAAELGARVGFIPEGTAAIGGLWKGLVPGYGAGGELAPLVYIASAFTGGVAVAAIVYLYGRLRGLGDR